MCAQYRLRSSGTINPPSANEYGKSLEQAGELPKGTRKNVAAAKRHRKPILRQSSRVLSLPGELRNQVYLHAFSHESLRVEVWCFRYNKGKLDFSPPCTTTPRAQLQASAKAKAFGRRDPSLLLVCRQTYNETRVLAFHSRRFGFNDLIQVGIFINKLLVDYQAQSLRHISLRVKFHIKEGEWRLREMEVPDFSWLSNLESIVLQISKPKTSSIAFSDFIATTEEDFQAESRFRAFGEMLRATLVCPTREATVTMKGTGRDMPVLKMNVGDMARLFEKALLKQARDHPKLAGQNVQPKALERTGHHTGKSNTRNVDGARDKASRNTFT